ncbi:hypothetical protein Tco_0731570 [Tanacetum coccineum]
MTTLESCNKHNIVHWEYILLGMTEAKDSEVCKITKADGTSSFHGDFQALFMGDMKMMFDPNKEDDIWLNQHHWELLRWKLHEYSGFYSLFLDGTSIQINMLVDKKYPLKKEILKKMINLKIEAEEESNMASELIKFIKSHIAEQINHKFRGGLLGIKELLQDMLLKNLAPLVKELSTVSYSGIFPSTTSFLSYYVDVPGPDEKRPFILGTPFLTTAKVVIKFNKGTIVLRSGKSKISFHRIPDSPCMIERGVKNDIEPIAPTMTVNKLVLEWEERIKLHLEREIDFNRWKGKNFKGKHPTLVIVEGRLDDKRRSHVIFDEKKLGRS